MLLLLEVDRYRVFPISADTIFPKFGKADTDISADIALNNIMWHVK